MRIGVLPFFSQQDKVTGKFILTTCGSTMIAKFLAKRMVTELDWQPVVYLPEPRSCRRFEVTASELDHHGIDWREMAIPLGNLNQRLTWDVRRWPELFGDLDGLISMQETMNWPLAQVMETLPIIGLYTLSPKTVWPWMLPFFVEGWRSVQAVRVLSQTMLREIVVEHPDVADIRHAAVWPMQYEMKIISDVLANLGEPWDQGRDIDVIFATRASETNYTKHLEFVAGLRLARANGWRGRVAFTDVTGYIRAHPELIAGIDDVIVFDGHEHHDQYIGLLRRGRYAVAMNHNGHGGATLRTAIMCGCVPLTPRSPEYVDLLGPDWEGYFHPSPAVIAHVLRKPPVNRSALEEMMRMASRESFEWAWTNVVKPDIQLLSLAWE